MPFDDETKKTLEGGTFQPGNVPNEVIDQVTANAIKALQRAAEQRYPFALFICEPEGLRASLGGCGAREMINIAEVAIDLVGQFEGSDNEH